MIFKVAALYAQSAFAAFRFGVGKTAFYTQVTIVAEFHGAGEIGLTLRA